MRGVFSIFLDQRPLVQVSGPLSVFFETGLFGTPRGVLPTHLSACVPALASSTLALRQIQCPWGAWCLPLLKPEEHSLLFRTAPQAPLHHPLPQGSSEAPLTPVTLS